MSEAATAHTTTAAPAMTISEAQLTKLAEMAMRVDDQTCDVKFTLQAFNDFAEVEWDLEDKSKVALFTVLCWMARQFYIQVESANEMAWKLNRELRDLLKAGGAAQPGPARAQAR